MRLTKNLRPGSAMRNDNGRTTLVPALVAAVPDRPARARVIYLDTAEEKVSFRDYVSTAEESIHIQEARGDRDVAAKIRARLDRAAVLISNTYSDGHESARVVELPMPDPAGNIDDWWNDVVYNETGDGHGASNPAITSHYEATVLYAPDLALVGAHREL